MHESFILVDHAIQIEVKKPFIESENQTIFKDAGFLFSSKVYVLWVVFPKIGNLQEFEPFGNMTLICIVLIQCSLIFCKTPNPFTNLH